MAKTIGSLRTLSGDYEIFLAKIDDVDLIFRFHRKENHIEVERNGEVMIREISLSTPVHRDFNIGETKRVIDISSQPPSRMFSKHYSVAIRIDGIPVSGTFAEPINRVLRAKSAVMAIIAIFGVRGVISFFVSMGKGNAAGGVFTLILYSLFAGAGIWVLINFRRNMRTALWVSLVLALLILGDHIVGIVMNLAKVDHFDANAGGQIIGFLMVGSIELGILLFIWQAIGDLKRFHTQSGKKAPDVVMDQSPP